MQKNVYKLAMVQPRPVAAYGSELQGLAPELIGARLEVARLRKYPRLSIRGMGFKLKDQCGVSMGAYYCHEHGQRRPPMPTLRAYADFFDIPIEYLLFGDDANIYEAEARASPAAQKRPLRIFSMKDSGAALSNSVNQPLRNGKLWLPETPELRFIVKLMATDLKKIAEGEVTLADISGEMRAVPSHLELGANIACYQIPDYDYSMAGGEAAFPPGTDCLMDLDAPIEPGKFVVALLKSQSEPVVRQYISDRNWTSGAKFRLKALNPNSEMIKVDDASDCLLILRIVYSVSPR